MSSIPFHMLLAAAGALFAREAAADPYDKMALGLADAAKRGGARSVTVLPFAAAGRPDPAGGIILAERLAERLAGIGGLRIVQQAHRDPAINGRGTQEDPRQDTVLFDDILTLLNLDAVEQCGTPQERDMRAGLEGTIKNRTLAAMKRATAAQTGGERAPPGADAFITGTFLPASGHRTEVHARLIGADSTLVLGLVNVRVDADWSNEALPPSDLLHAGVAGVAAALTAAVLWFIARSVAN